MAGPAGRVTALTATTFTVTVDSVTGTLATTLRLQTRALGSAGNWTTQASDATPAINDTLQATGLTTGTALEWRIVQEPASLILEDGTHGVVVPSAAPWGTLLSTVETALSGLTVYKGAAPLRTYPAATAVLTMRTEEVREVANNVTLTEYPVAVELRLRDTDPQGTQHYTDVAKWQRVVIDAFDGADAADYPGITGLEGVSVEVVANDEASPSGAYSNEARATTVVKFGIWE
jgi:hypothetical protein